MFANEKNLRLVLGGKLLLDDPERGEELVEGLVRTANALQALAKPVCVPMGALAACFELLAPYGHGWNRCRYWNPRSRRSALLFYPEDGIDSEDLHRLVRRREACRAIAQTMREDVRVPPQEWAQAGRWFFETASQYELFPWVDRDASAREWEELSYIEEMGHVWKVIASPTPGIQEVSSLLEYRAKTGVSVFQDNTRAHAANRAHHLELCVGKRDA